MKRYGILVVLLVLAAAWVFYRASLSAEVPRAGVRGQAESAQDDGPGVRAGSELAQQSAESTRESTAFAPDVFDSEVRLGTVRPWGRTAEAWPARIDGVLGLGGTSPLSEGGDGLLLDIAASEFALPSLDQPPMWRADAWLRWQMQVPGRRVANAWAPGIESWLDLSGSKGVEVLFSEVPVVRALCAREGTDLEEVLAVGLSGSVAMEEILFGFPLTQRTAGGAAIEPAGRGVWESSPFPRATLAATDVWMVAAPGHGFTPLFLADRDPEFPAALTLLPGGSLGLTPRFGRESVERGDELLVQLEESGGALARSLWSARIRGENLATRGYIVLDHIPAGRYAFRAQWSRAGSILGTSEGFEVSIPVGGIEELEFALVASRGSLGNAGVLLFEEPELAKRLERVLAVPTAAIGPRTAVSMTVGAELQPIAGGYEWAALPLPPGWNAFQLEPLGMAILAHVDPQGTPVTIDVPLRTEALIHLRDPRGNPLGEVELSVSQVFAAAGQPLPRPPRPEVWPGSVTLPAQGTARIPVLPEALLALSVQLPGSAPAEALFSLREGYEHEWVLEPTRRLNVLFDRAPPRLPTGWWEAVQIEFADGALEPVPAVSRPASPTGTPAGPQPTSLWIPRQGVVAIHFPPLPGAGPRRVLLEPNTRELRLAD